MFIFVLYTIHKIPNYYIMTDKSSKNWISMSDHALTKQIGNFVRHQRVEQNKTQDALAMESGISRSTLSLLERGETVTVATLIQVLRMLDRLDIMDSFEIKETISPLDLVKKQKVNRQRVRVKSKGTEKKEQQIDW